MTPPDPSDEIVRHLPSMRAFAISLTRDHVLADDIVQDAIVKAWTNLDKFREGSNMSAWLMTIVRNTFYSSRRTAYREVSDGGGFVAESLAIAPPQDGFLQFEEFKAAYAELSVVHREALMLVGVLGFTYEEAAQTCGTAVGTMKSRTNRAREQLALKMKITSSDSFDVTDAETTSVVRGSRKAAF